MSCCDAGEPEKQGPDIFNLDAPACLVAARYGMASFFVDGEFDGLAEAIFAVMVRVAFHVAQ